MGRPPNMPMVGITPSNFREVIQRQIAKTVNSKVDEIVSFSVDGSDGRIQYPADETFFRDPVGRFYHVVGVSTSDDMTVAAP